MHHPLHRRALLQAALGASALFSLRPAAACEYFAPTLRITHPWTAATPASAPFAVLGMRFDEVSADDQLIDVHTPVAQAVVFVPHGPAVDDQASTPPSLLPAMHASGLPLNIPAGLETVLGNSNPHGPAPHLRLLRLTQDLEAGRSYPLHLVFKRGGLVKATLNVDYARFG